MKKFKGNKKPPHPEEREVAARKRLKLLLM